jgi:uncharacterized repeat protein (TIGR01451 family)
LADPPCENISLASLRRPAATTKEVPTLLLGLVLAVTSNALDGHARRVPSDAHVRESSIPEPSDAAHGVSGLFRPWVSRPIGSMEEAVAIGDLNNDGRDDVALVTSWYADPANDFRVHVFLQDSSGGLAPAAKYALHPLPGGPNQRLASVDIGDVTGDGLEDAVVANRLSIIVFRQTQFGTLEPWDEHATVDSYQVKIGDFNDDGRQDVVQIEWATPEVAVYLQNASGRLDPPVVYNVDHWQGEVEVGDVNSDGRDDVVVLGADAVQFYTVKVLLQSPSGTLDPPVTYDVPGTHATKGAAVADVTGDGRHDVVVSYGGNLPSSHIAVFPQNAGGTLDPPVSYPSSDIPQPVEAADVNGDGRNDVVTVHGGWRSVGLYLQNASGGLAPEVLEAVPYATHYMSQGMALGDVDGDGQVDVVIADYNFGLVRLYHNPANDLGLTLADGPDPAMVGSNVTYTLVATNRGAFPATGVTVTHALHPGQTFVSSSPTGACTPAPHVVTCVLPDLMPGGAATVEITASAALPGTYVSHASLVAAQPDDVVLDNQATAVTQVTTAACEQLVVDGGFELGAPNPQWSESSTTFGTPLCSASVCGSGGGTALPYAGAWWGWFGGSPYPERASLGQWITIPPGQATLRFRFWIGFGRYNGEDSFRAFIDGIPLLTIREGDARHVYGYRLVEADVSSFADGQAHLLTFESVGLAVDNGVTNMSLDEVALSWCPLPAPLAPLTVNDAFGAEGEGAAVFIVAPASPVTAVATVEYATADGTALAGSDYAPRAGTLTFAAGATAPQTILVPVLGDAEDEPTERFTLRLSMPTNTTISDGEGVATITDDDAGAFPVTELVHGTVRIDDLRTPPGPVPVADRDLYVVRLAPHSSFEVSVDGASGDLGIGAGPRVQQMAGDLTTVISESKAVGSGPVRSLRLRNPNASALDAYVRVTSASCALDCGPDDTYRVTALETTTSIPRFSNVGSLASVVILQNPAGEGIIGLGGGVLGTVHFWSTTGALLATETFALNPRTTLVFPTASIPALAGQSGSITVVHDAPYGQVLGKVVALDPSTGFSFDTPMLFRPR